MARTAQIAAGAGLTLAGLAGLNALVRTRAGKLPEALHEGERRSYAWRHGRVSYRVAGEGTPLLLLHGVYAGAASFEWRRNFGELAQHFRVFAPDLIGFGRSDRPAIHYTDDLYVDLLHDFARDLFPEPAFAIANSLSDAFLVADAAAHPESYLDLILVSPPALSGKTGMHGPGARAANVLMRTPFVGTAVYNAMVSRPSIEAELNKIYERRDAFDDDAIRFYYKSSHQPGAKWAATSFIGGALNRDIRGEFRALQVPVLLVWGDDPAYSPVSNAAEYLGANPHAEMKVFEECGSLPQEEHPDRFNALVVERFLGASGR